MQWMHMCSTDVSCEHVAYRMYVCYLCNLFLGSGTQPNDIKKH